MFNLELLLIKPQKKVALISQQQPSQRTYNIGFVNNVVFFN